jgi:ABC-2 type transport system ATP-binding protein
LIRAEHLTKRFGKVQAVTDVSFEVTRGEVVGFLGPNGAGKTTTLRMLAGVFPPSTGRAAIGGHDVVHDGLAARRHVGYFPERIALYGEMTVRAYLRYVAALKDVPARERAADVAAVMGACDLDGVEGRRVDTLSKGYRQRVGIAQALLGGPGALLLDEPTAGLDPEQVAEMRTLIRGLAAERAILLSSHDLAEVELTCDRVVILGDGRVLAVGPPAQLAERLRRVSRVVLEIAGPADPVAVTAAIRTVAHVVTVEVLAPASPAFSCLRLRVDAEAGHDPRSDLVRAIVAGGFPLVEIRTAPLSLEDVFLALVGSQKTR